MGGDGTADGGMGSGWVLEGLGAEFAIMEEGGLASGGVTLGSSLSGASEGSDVAVCAAGAKVLYEGRRV